ncbi:DUF4270 domain-containing protein [Aquiflexum gelatinilyticum]|uniref:DUF4270 domain-containing protein n=1 Tax=Aquiflexum gelatinilyticum TaxID=2961943 RepID=A0A9X2SZ22_9BACT|nr:DUF4270 domain-containing protein [Aquiflexum gelatinilyticum]MCR9016157.1 DUF4270 domain-containing protein [Aquiflexum gelatinilyticum]MCS4436803.1 DUF4270 domain-containing protein [Aquiflexum gelatinilyticum]
MTWPAKLSAILFIVLTIATSCEDPSNIGLELDPENNQIGVFYQEISLSASVVLQDSLSTTNSGVLVYGNEESDFFGKTESIGYTRLFFNRDIARPKENAILDSVRFLFNMREVLTADTINPKTINVHLLTEQIRDVDYYNFSSVAYEPTPSFSATFDFTDRQDTIVSTKIDNALTQEIFDELKDGRYFQDIFSFREFLPGLAFKAEEGENVGFSTVIGNNTGFIFYFKNEGDTVSRAYPIATGINFNLARHFSQVINDPTGTPIEVVTEPTTSYDLGQYAGGKSTFGMYIKLDMSPLDEFLDTLENANFNQVTLEMGPVVNFSADRLPPQFHIMFFTNETNEVLFRTDGLPMAVQPEGRVQVDPVTSEPIYSDQPALLAFINNEKFYRQFITSHVNALYRKKMPRRDFLLYPAVSTQDRNFIQSLKDYVIDQNTIKMKIFYSRSRSL